MHLVEMMLHFADRVSAKSGPHQAGGHESHDMVSTRLLGSNSSCISHYCDGTVQSGPKSVLMTSCWTELGAGATGLAAPRGVTGCTTAYNAVTRGQQHSPDCRCAYGISTVLVCEEDKQYLSDGTARTIWQWR